MVFQLAKHAKHDFYQKNKDNNLWEKILKTICNPGSLLVSLEVEGHGMKNHQIFHYIKTSLPIPLMWASSKVYHIQHRVLIVFPSPTHKHEKLNSLRWEIIFNATTWLAITTVHRSRVVTFVYSAFEKALLCAHLLNQNLISPYLKTVLHPKYSLQACLLVLVMLLLM